MILNTGRGHHTTLRDRGDVLVKHCDTHSERFRPVGSWAFSPAQGIGKKT
jgi:hypothetical protein